MTKEAKHDERNLTSKLHNQAKKYCTQNTVRYITAYYKCLLLFCLLKLNIQMPYHTNIIKFLEKNLPSSLGENFVALQHLVNSIDGDEALGVVVKLEVEVSLEEVNEPCEKSRFNIVVLKSVTWLQQNHHHHHVSIISCSTSVQGLFFTF